MDFLCAIKLVLTLSNHINNFLQHDLSNGALPLKKCFLSAVINYILSLKMPNTNCLWLWFNAAVINCRALKERKKEIQVILELQQLELEFTLLNNVVIKCDITSLHCFTIAILADPVAFLNSGWLRLYVRTSFNEMLWLSYPVKIQTKQGIRFKIA